MTLRAKKKEKTERQKIIQANDDLFRKIIHLRDKVCQKSGRSENLQVAHFWTRGNLRVRWDLDNACLLQGGIHYFWAHVKPQEFREFWIKRLGQERFDKLEIKARYVAPIKLYSLYLTHSILKSEIKKMESNQALKK